MNRKIYTRNGKLLISSGTGNVLQSGSPIDPYNPLNLPPFTIRVKFSSGYTPYMGDSQVLVDPVENVWDITKNSTDWQSLLWSSASIPSGYLPTIEILGANSSGVTNMLDMINYNTMLESVAIFDTSSVTNITYMLEQCSSLKHIPLFDTRNVNRCIAAFRGCTNVESGALAMYNQLSTQANVPQYHSYCFTDCGINTASGLAELQQIPQSWGGLAAG